PLTAGGHSPRDSLVYDAQGNLAKTVSPAGLLTLHYRDALGRDTLTVTPIDSAAATTEAGRLAGGERQRTAYRGVEDRALVVEPRPLHDGDAPGRGRPAVPPTGSAAATAEAGLLAGGVRPRTVYDGVMDRVLVSETLSPARAHAASPDNLFQPAASPAERLVV